MPYDARTEDHIRLTGRPLPVALAGRPLPIDLAKKATPIDMVWGAGFEGRSSRPIYRTAPGGGGGGGVVIDSVLLTEAADYMTTENGFFLEFQF